MTEITIDPEFSELCPPLTQEEYLGLVDSITSEGCRDPILLWKNVIVDGHNRYKICTQHKIPYQTKDISFIDKNDAKIWIINNQLSRRNIDKWDRKTLVDKEDEIKELIERGKENQRLSEGRPKKGLLDLTNLNNGEIHKVEVIEPIRTRKKRAEKIEVSETTLHRMDVVEKEKPEMIPLIKKHEISLNKVFNDIKREELKEELTNKIPDLPTDKYRVIYADPPWRYGDTMAGLDEYGYGIAAEKHYITMSIEELCNMEIPNITEDNAVLFIWVTSPLLEDVFKVIKAWGFKYKTSFVWDKIKHNMGHYNSVRHELLLICTKGSCTPDVNKLFDSVQTIERSKEHSEKPEEFRQIIDTIYTHGKKLEMFARKEVAGWDHYGTT